MLRTALKQVTKTDIGKVEAEAQRLSNRYRLGRDPRSKSVSPPTVRRFDRQVWRLCTGNTKPDKTGSAATTTEINCFFVGELKAETFRL
jgi:hypothetical protein